MIEETIQNLEEEKRYAQRRIEHKQRDIQEYREQLDKATKDIELDVNRINGIDKVIEKLRK